MNYSTRFFLRFNSLMLRFCTCLLLVGQAMVPAQGANLNAASELPNVQLDGGWQALPHNGLNGPVRAMLLVGNDLYVGGIFSATADGQVTNLNNIAKFSNGTWSALSHNGLNDGVLALAYYNGDLYVGGRFTETADSAVMNLNYIAKYKIQTTDWLALPGNGFGRCCVKALAFNGSSLYVGGGFGATADHSVLGLNNIARLDGGWSALPNGGLDSEVRALAMMGGDLYAGGEFFGSYDHTVDSRILVRLSGNAWQPYPVVPQVHGVYSLLARGNDLYVGGRFSGPCGGNPVGNIARFISGTCLGFANQALDHNVLGLAVIGNDLYAGGSFTYSYDLTVTTLTTTLNHIGLYSGGSWSPLPGNGLNGLSVSTLLVWDGFLYVGGEFSGTSDGSVGNLNNIARFSLPRPFKIYLPLCVK